MHSSEQKEATVASENLASKLSIMKRVCAEAKEGAIWNVLVARAGGVGTRVLAKPVGVVQLAVAFTVAVG